MNDSKLLMKFPHWESVIIGDIPSKMIVRDPLFCYKVGDTAFWSNVTMLLRSNQREHGTYLRRANQGCQLKYKNEIRIRGKLVYSWQVLFIYSVLTPFVLP